MTLPTWALEKAREFYDKHFGPPAMAEEYDALNALADLLREARAMGPQAEQNERALKDILALQEQLKAAEARLAALTTAEGCDVEGAARAVARELGLDPDDGRFTDEAKKWTTAAAIAALAAGCAPLMAILREFIECAKYDPTIPSPTFKGWDRSGLDRCLKRALSALKEPGNG